MSFDVGILGLACPYVISLSVAKIGFIFFTDNFFVLKKVFLSPERL